MFPILSGYYHCENYNGVSVAGTNRMMNDDNARGRKKSNLAKDLLHGSTKRIENRARAQITHSSIITVCIRVRCQ